MTIGERIKKYRIQKGMTQQELADLMHVTKQCISQYEHDKKLPSVDNAGYLSDIFEIPYELFIKGNEEQLIDIEIPYNVLYSDVLKNILGYSPEKLSVTSV